MGIVMNSDYKENDYLWIKELLDYTATLERRLGRFFDTSQILLPEDPIDCVIFQDRAKRAIRKIAQNKGHILMVGRPGTGNRSQRGARRPRMRHASGLVDAGDSRNVERDLVRFHDAHTPSRRSWGTRDIAPAFDLARDRPRATGAS